MSEVRIPCDTACLTSCGVLRLLECVPLCTSADVDRYSEWIKAGIKAKTLKTYKAFTTSQYALLFCCRFLTGADMMATVSRRKAKGKENEYAHEAEEAEALKAQILAKENVKSMLPSPLIAFLLSPSSLLTSCVCALPLSLTADKSGSSKAATTKVACAAFSLAVTTLSHVRTCFCVCVCVCACVCVIVG